MLRCTGAAWGCQHCMCLVAPHAKKGLCTQTICLTERPFFPLFFKQAAKEALRDGVLPSLTDAAVQHALASDTLDTHLLGFETGGG